MLPFVGNDTKRSIISDIHFCDFFGKKKKKKWMPECVTHLSTLTNNIFLL